MTRPPGQLGTQVVVAEQAWWPFLYRFRAIAAAHGGRNHAYEYRRRAVSLCGNEVVEGRIVPLFLASCLSIVSSSLGDSGR